MHATDQLFGLEVFVRPTPTDGDAAGASTDSQAGVPVFTASQGLSDSVEMGDSGALISGPVGPDTETADATGQLQSAMPQLTIRALLSRRIVLSLVFFLMISTVGMSLFTLVMKTRKKAVSYELAHQTRLFKRMSKHRAIYELEYAYLRAGSPIMDEFSRQGWREITPHDLTYIPVKDADSGARGGPIW
ncbi:MAG: hypothetical protein CVU59_02945 [Deltaproteobacteria bacterium HGW-Deltaproteobacteria-17]|nr:MAG: hypothetical protein CVU59_02945 [Deltaproteobacteria bacterium HGW-Deltaproteobacteria-17]